MIYTDCRYECGDDDCNKCYIRGYIFTCTGCNLYERHPAMDKRRLEENEDEEKRKP